MAESPLAALDDRPRPGREPTITIEAKAWLIDLACRKAKDFGYPHELWTTRLLAWHAREHGPTEGHACFANLAQGTVCKILDQEDVKPHKVRYYLERRDPDFAEKMAEVLCVYRQVKILKKAAAVSKTKPSDQVAIVSYDEKWVSRPSPRPPRTCRPGPACMRPSHASMNISATARSACWPESISSPARFSRPRQGPSPQSRIHRIPQASRRRLSGPTAIKLIPDNHSAHISKETRAWLADQPTHRFEFIFTPKHGSWLNLIEGFFSKLTRSVLRHIRVTSKQELKNRLMAAMDDFNQRPVVHTWTYKLDKAA